jgi:hypothetical protein
MKMFKILGTDDSVNACDCCGKTGLKHTVTVEVEGEIFHYGSVCATRHTGMTAPAVKKAIDRAYETRMDAALSEFRKSPEYLAYEVALTAARRTGLVGLEFKKLVHAEYLASDAKSVEIAARHNVRLLRA